MISDDGQNVSTSHLTCYTTVIVYNFATIIFSPFLETTGTKLEVCRRTAEEVHQCSGMHLKWDSLWALLDF